MKKILSLVFVAFTSLATYAQSPGKISYQAVVRNSGNTLVLNQAVGIQISILQGSPTGTATYVETHTPTTNANGLASLEIGSGTVVSGTMSGIDWSAGPYYTKTEIDPTGGTNYTISGTSQILSVPYALHATTATNVTNDQVNDADSDPNNELITGGTLNGTNLEITDAGGTTTVDLSSLQGGSSAPTTTSLGGPISNQILNYDVINVLALNTTMANIYGFGMTIPTGSTILIANESSLTIEIHHQNVGIHQFSNPGGVSYYLDPGAIMQVMYDGTYYRIVSGAHP